MSTKGGVRRRRLGLIGIAVVVVLALVGFGLSGSGLSGSGLSGSGKGTTEWGEARREDLVVSVEVSGTLEAVETSLLGPPGLADVWQYKLARLAPEGSLVKKGTPVLGFDTADLERTLAEKRAESDEAVKEIEKKAIDRTIRQRDERVQRAEVSARLRRATLTLNVPEDVRAADELAQARLDQGLARREIEGFDRRSALMERATEAELAQLRDKRDRAQARVREIEAAIARMRIVAPRDGTVIHVVNRRGEKKKVGDTCWRADYVLEIPDLARMRAKGEVDEADAGRVAVGQRVTLRVDALPDVEPTGTIAKVYAAIEAPLPGRPQRVVRVDVALDTADVGAMRPGMRYRGHVEIERARAILVVPADAVFPSADGPMAWVAGRMGDVERRVEVGRRNEKLVES